MRRIAVINQKGGVGKTTTTVNVGAALARAGHRVLMIDLDPQAHMTLHFGLNPADGRPGIYELLIGKTTMPEATTQMAENLWVIGANIDLAAAEIELVSILGREVILRDLLVQYTGADGENGTAAFDYVLMDCPPSLGVLTLNGLCAAREVMIPLQPHYLALQGLSKLLETVSLVDKRINPGLKVSGVVICMKESGTRLGAEVVEDVRSFLEAARNSPVPWGEARVFETSIRRNIKLAEAPSYGQSIFDYAADSNGAKDYELLAAEIHDPAAFATRGQAAPEVVQAAEPAAAAIVESNAPAEAIVAEENPLPATAEAISPGESSHAVPLAACPPVNTTVEDAAPAEPSAVEEPLTIPMPPPAIPLPPYESDARAVG